MRASRAGKPARLGRVQSSRCEAAGEVEHGFEGEFGNMALLSNVLTGTNRAELAIKVCAQRAREGLAVVQLAFPNCQNTPTLGFQIGLVTRIAGHGIGSLRRPENHVARRSRLPRAARVGVPETAVDEHNLVALCEHDVWFPRKPSDVQPVPVAQRVQKSSDNPFGFRVYGTNTRHGSASLRGAHDVRHDTNATPARLTCGKRVSSSVHPLECQRGLGLFSVDVDRTL